MPAFFFECYDAHRDLHSFPTRRSSDLIDCRYDPAQDPHVAGGRCEHEITTIGRNSGGPCREAWLVRSEEHTSELQSQSNLVCRLLLEKKKHTQGPRIRPHRPYWTPWRA